MLRELLKSKIHRATVSDSNIEYEGSISIARYLMDAVDLWPGEKVQVVSITSGARLETYVIEPPEGSAGAIVINGAAGHLIKAGERVTIMGYAQSEIPITPKRVVLDSENAIVRQG